MIARLTPGEVPRRNPTYALDEVKNIDFPVRGSGTGAELGRDRKHEVPRDVRRSCEVKLVLVAKRT